MVKPSIVVLAMSIFPAWECQANELLATSHGKCLKKFKSWEQGHRWLCREGYALSDEGPGLYIFQQYPFEIGPVAPAPFPTKDNGSHRYFEDAEVIVLANHGSPVWIGMERRGKDGYAPLASGYDAAEVMAETRRLRAIPPQERASV